MYSTRVSFKDLDTNGAKLEREKHLARPHNTKDVLTNVSRIVQSATAASGHETTNSEHSGSVDDHFPTCLEKQVGFIVRSPSRSQ